MRPGSVVVDLASEAGGNIETTKPGQLYINENGVVHIGYTDLPSRLPTQASSLYANNISKLLLSMGEKDHFNLDFDDEVVRGSIVLHAGKLMWPPPKPKEVPVAAPPTKVAKAPPPPPNYFMETVKSAGTYTGGLASMIALGMLSPNAAFSQMLTTFGLAGIVGYHTVVMFI